MLGVLPFVAEQQLGFALLSDALTDEVGTGQLHLHLLLLGLEALAFQGVFARRAQEHLPALVVITSTSGT